MTDRENQPTLVATRGDTPNVGYALWEDDSLKVIDGGFWESTTGKEYIATFTPDKWPGFHMAPRTAKPVEIAEAGTTRRLEALQRQIKPVIDSDQQRLDLLHEEEDKNDTLRAKLTTLEGILHLRSNGGELENWLYQKWKEAEAGTTAKIEEAKTDALAWEEKCDFQTAALRDLDIAFRALKTKNTRLLNENMEGAACNLGLKAKVEELEKALREAKPKSAPKVCVWRRTGKHSFVTTCGLNWIGDWGISPICSCGGVIRVEGENDA